MIKGHLSNDEFTAYLLGARQATEHVRSCAECSTEAERVAQSLNAFKMWVHQRAEAEAPNLNVLAEQREKRSFVMWFSWSAIVALIVMAAALMLMTPPQNPKPEAAVTSSQPDADDALLLAVQEDLDRSVPQALAPAALLAQERNRVIKERRVHNQ